MYVFMNLSLDVKTNSGKCPYSHLLTLHLPKRFYREASRALQTNGSVSYRDPRPTVFIPAVVMWSVISEHCHSWERMVLDILQRCSYLLFRK